MSLSRESNLLKNNSGLNLIWPSATADARKSSRPQNVFAREAIENPALVDTMDETLFHTYLYTHAFPDPELVIRTAGKKG